MTTHTATPPAPADTSINTLAPTLAAADASSDFIIEETHISWVVLTKHYAFKIKKPVKFAFLDFSTLDKRKYYCEHELRLNRRFAPALYLSVVPIHGSSTHPTLDSRAGAAFEYAVKMLRFDAEQRCDRMITQHRFTDAMAGALAEHLGQVHKRLPACSIDSLWGTPEAIQQAMSANFTLLDSLETEPAHTTLAELKNWSTQEFARLAPLFSERKQNGFVRECHGDLHLGNIAWHQDKPLLFDCIEFNEAFRWIDVMSDVAFAVMDFADHDHADFASRFLNRYLQTTGDYGGISLLPYYLVYRALVRAKVSLLRVRQESMQKPAHAARDQDATNPHFLECNKYIQLASHYARKQAPHLIILHGLPGSGKSVLADSLCVPLNAIIIRSDIERKRLAGLPALAHSGCATNQGLYTSSATQRVYAHLLSLASCILGAGFTVIIDASFLKKHQRDLFHNLARQKQIPFTVLSAQAPQSVLKSRIEYRLDTESDASEASQEVLDAQYAQQEPLHETEIEYTLFICTDKTVNVDYIVSKLARTPLGA